jgi:hypothetical protein
MPVKARDAVVGRRHGALVDPGPVARVRVFIERPLRVMTALLRHRIRALRPVRAVLAVRAAIPKRPILKQFVGHRSIF